MLQREDLPAIAQRILGQQPQLGKAVEHHPLGPQGFDALHDAADGFAELQFGGMQQRLFLIGANSPSGTSSNRSSPSSVQPWVRATARSSAAVSDSVM